MKDGAVLMGRRMPTEDRFAGFWEFPGGKIEAGESDEEALRREIQEEIGCDLVTAEHFRSIEWEYPDRVIDLRFYLVTLSCDNPTQMLLEAHEELRWYKLDDVSKLSIMPANEQIISELTKLYR